MREAGVLAAVFSLPGRYGIGDFGINSYRFIDFLKRTNVKIWQVLPLNPVGFGNSPYQPFSSFAGEPLYIDLAALHSEGLLPELPPAFRKHAKSVDYEAVRAYKEPYFREAFKNFKGGEDYEAFRSEEWVYLYAVFRVLASHNYNASWFYWKEEDRDWIKDRSRDLSAYQEEIDYQIFLQYMFRKQWTALKKYANDSGISIMGDIPFYVGENSLDVWMNQEEFRLNEQGFPIEIAGVPPDYFSADGQRWGNPIYDWEHMKANGFRFWKERMLHTAEMYDLVRIDHFRAFDSYWVIPASSPTAIVGEWKYAPGYELFDQLLPMIPDTGIVAEDLGEMRQEVYWLRDHYQFPGMNVLQFTWFDRHFDLRENMITYTGTHDNNTIAGWYRTLTPKEKRSIRYKLDIPGGNDRDVSRALVRAALNGPTNRTVIAVQDILGLGGEGRVNTPSTVGSPNWEWKMDSLAPLLREEERFRKAVQESGRG